MKTTTFWWCCLLVSTLLVPPSQGETLRGVTIENWPYVAQRKNGQFEGFCVELLNEIFKLMGHTYTLKLVDDGKYGGWLTPNGTLDGVVGMVNRGEVDFAIGDITSTTIRARYVDITQPFLEFGLAAVVRREVLDSLGYAVKSFKDLSEQTNLRYGVKRTGANLPLFHDSPVVKRMYSYMDTHPSVFVTGEKEGLAKVRKERYAFIVESSFAEYVVQRDCALVAIDDRRKHFQFEYAILLPKASRWKPLFDRALIKLKRRGVLRDLKDKYWRTNQCQRDEDGNEDGSDTINFSARSTLKDDRVKDALIKPSDPYRGPHEVVDESDFEYIKPKQDDNRRRKKPEKPIRRKDEGGGGSAGSMKASFDRRHLLLAIASVCLILLL